MKRGEADIIIPGGANFLVSFEIYISLEIKKIEGEIIIIRNIIYMQGVK